MALPNADHALRRRHGLVGFAALAFPVHFAIQGDPAFLAPHPPAVRRKLRVPPEGTLGCGRNVRVAAHVAVTEFHLQLDGAGPHVDAGQVVSHHEMGHALTAQAPPGSETAHGVSIRSQGIDPLGYELQSRDDGPARVSRSELPNKFAVPLGGRAAWKLEFDACGRATTVPSCTHVRRRWLDKEALDHAKLAALTAGPKRGRCASARQRPRAQAHRPGCAHR